MVDFWAGLEVSLIIRNTKQVKYISSKQFITTKAAILLRLALFNNVDSNELINIFSKY